MFRRLLIANRGEIARRIIRGAHALGIEAVAVYSEADRDAPFVREADLAVCLGPARAAESYLDGEAILQAAAQTHSQAIHPGYGFLSENALFAQMVLQQRLGWVGPSPSVIRAMGEKAPAKAAMRRAGLPLVPGSDGIVANVEQAIAIAERLGYPVLLKADAGGGGKGMRRADDRRSLVEAWQAAEGEARASFGSGALYLEAYLERARHIEFQILADSWGNAIHLLERECSIQRRHQKLLEEAPSVAIDEELREKMGTRVAQAVAAVGYSGAGTVEFLLDVDRRELYFIEMNTRLQVEHPVTEEITGIDLVQAQIRVAAGERLWLAQSDVRGTGHAIEVRINAEDPDAGFRPTPGTITRFDMPAGALGAGRVRVDAAVESGSKIPPYYDSLVAKLIGWGPDRAAAIDVLRAALDRSHIDGIATTIALHKRILAAPEFAQGDLRVGHIPSLSSPGWILGAV
ncbi:MAG: acetyl-CoA carboxylase biotin carboxylase subunit [Deltaproteobacteria bacterium]|nr:acetyl-CoA carboxylase biotin carboxylase subunit [Deltaproteobacteria bacterium]